MANSAYAESTLAQGGWRQRAGLGNAPLSTPSIPQSVPDSGTVESTANEQRDYIIKLQQEAAAQQMAYQTQSAERAMRFSAEEAQKNRDFQEYMSSTAFRRQMSDMRKAGLNPILAYQSATGASTPAGSSASGVAQSGSQAQITDKNYIAELLSAVGSILSGVGSIVPF